MWKVARLWVRQTKRDDAAGRPAWQSYGGRTGVAEATASRSPATRHV
jgi:hypothetical protein